MEIASALDRRRFLGVTAIITFASLSGCADEETEETEDSVNNDDTEQYTVTITVEDTSEEKVEGATVIIGDQDNKILYDSETDSEGLAELHVPDGEYTVSSEYQAITGSEDLDVDGSDEEITITLEEDDDDED